MTRLNLTSRCSFITYVTLNKRLIFPISVYPNGTQRYALHLTCAWLRVDDHLIGTDPYFPCSTNNTPSPQHSSQETSYFTKVYRATITPVHHKSLLSRSEHGKPIMKIIRKINEVGGPEPEASIPPIWPLQPHPTWFQPKSFRRLL